MSDNLCYFCGKDVGGMYIYHWGHKCHLECETGHVAKKKTADEIITLRERLEQAELSGFRAGIEAAYEVSGKYHQITHVREAIRALIDDHAQSPDKDKPCLSCGISDDGIGCGCDHGLQDQPSPEPVAWLWYCECASGDPVISFGRWPCDPQQKRYKLAEIQPTEHDHPSPPDNTPTVAEAAKVLLNAWRNSETVTADDEAQNTADLYEVSIDAFSIVESWLHALAAQGDG